MRLPRKPRFRQSRAATLGAILGMTALSMVASCSDDDPDGDAIGAGAPNGGSAAARGGSGGRGGRAGWAPTGGAPVGPTGSGGEEDEPRGNGGSGGGEGEIGGTGGEPDDAGSTDGTGGSTGGIGGTGGKGGGDDEAGGSGGEEDEAGGNGGNGQPEVGGGASGEGGAGSGEAGAGGGGGVAAACGDGAWEPSEECDDGGLEADDGCSATCAVEYIFDRGHIDFFELSYDDGLVLKVKDSTFLYTDTAYREPERVVINVDAARAAFIVPDGLPPEVAFLPPAGTTIYLLPFDQDFELPWPGWNTERLATTLPPAVLADLPTSPEFSVELEIEVSGPGDVFVFANGGEKAIDTTDDVPERISTFVGTHVHTNWAFTALGDYSLKVTPRLLQRSSADLVGPQREFRFHIGTRLLAEESAPALTLSPEGATYQVGQTVEMVVNAEPEPVNPRYAWQRYHSSEEIMETLEERGDTLRFTAGAPVAEDVISVWLLSNRTGRRLAQAGGSLTIAE